MYMPLEIKERINGNLAVLGPGSTTHDMEAISSTL